MKLLSTLALALLLFSGCVSKKKYDQALADNDKLRRDLASCRESNASLGREVKDLRKQVDDLKNDTTRLGTLVRDLQRQLQDKDRRMANLKAEYDQMKSQSSKDIQDKIDQLNRLRAELEEREKRLEEVKRLLSERDRLLEALRDRLTAALKEFEKMGISVYEKDGRIYVSMSDKLLFESGKFSVNKDGRNALIKLSQVLNANLDVGIIIEGHTDNVPLKSSGTHPADNWELSVLRATTVTKILVEDGKVDTKRLIASGRGEYFPIAGNESADGRARNRRTEIILEPNIQSILEQIKKTQ
jgi:chemotaxis protein MotB